ncbi:MAG: YdcF family protein [Parcubacteria group bacterium]|nr:YdcF family protein [Parcubacteria group bacterium]
MNTDSAAELIWDYMQLHQPLEKADAIFVLGSSDLRVPAYAAELYLEGWAPLIIFSGRDGKGKTMELWGMTEAEKFTEVAMSLGVPEDKILLEKEATNTGDNVQFTKQLLKEKGVEVGKLILIQKPYMERRTYATFAKQWPDMDFVVTSPPISFKEYPNEERTKEYLINMMVGDLQRIKEYPAKGFQIEQEIPDDVWQAYVQLVAEGYTQHLIK